MAKLAGDGTLTWHTFLGGDSSDYAENLAVDAGSGDLLIADTYNSKLKRIDPVTGATTTYLGGEQGWAWRSRAVMIILPRRPGSSIISPVSTSSISTRNRASFTCIPPGCSVHSNDQAPISVAPA